VIARADSISPYYLLFGRVPGSEREVKVKLKMPESLFDCYETAYISRIHFEIRSRLENSHTVTGQIEAMDYLTEEVHKPKNAAPERRTSRASASLVRGRKRRRWRFYKWRDLTKWRR